MIGVYSFCDALSETSFGGSLIVGSLAAPRRWIVIWLFLLVFILAFGGAVFGWGAMVAAVVLFIGLFIWLLFSWPWMMVWWFCFGAYGMGSEAAVFTALMTYFSLAFAVLYTWGPRISFEIK